MSKLSEKLKIKSGSTLQILNAPAGYIRQLSADLNTNQILVDLTSTKRISFIQLFAYSGADLEVLPSLLSQLEPNGLLWLCYQKNSTGGRNNLTRDKGWDVVEKEGYRPVAIVAIDDDWAAIRWRKSEDVKVMRRNIHPEIDIINRVVHLPDDVALAFNKSNVLDRFNRLSFTHKKEYIEEIVSAKKLLTRASRIDKTIQQIRKLK